MAGPAVMSSSSAGVEAEPQHRAFRNLLIEVPGVLLLPDDAAASSTSHAQQAVPEKLIKRILRTTIWFDHETGKLSAEEAIRLLAQKLPAMAAFPEAAVRACLLERAMSPAPALLQMLDRLQAAHPSVRVFCASNVSREEHRRLQAAFPELYSRFRAVFTSFELGVRKPAMAFLRRVVRDAGILPEDTLLVDCSPESALSARALGMAAVVVDGDESVREIVSHFRDDAAIAAAAATFLRASKFLPSLTSDGVQIRDAFSWFLAADVLGDPDFLPVQAPPASGLFTYCSADEAEPGLSASDFSSNSYILTAMPPDLDTTSVGLSVLHRFGKAGTSLIRRVLDQMLQFRSQDDGVLEVYFDHARPRVDAVVAANALFLFHLAGRGEEAAQSEEFVRAVLQHRAYLDGTLYYKLPESFLFAVSRLVAAFLARFAPLREVLTARLLERAGREDSDALALAMRIIACGRCGVEADARDVQRLARLQNLDGSWDVCPITRYGSDAKSWIGNRAVSTAFALAAFKMKDKEEATCASAPSSSYKNIVFDMGECCSHNFPGHVTAARGFLHS